VTVKSPDQGGRSGLSTRELEVTARKGIYCKKSLVSVGLLWAEVGQGSAGFESGRVAGVDEVVTK